MKYYGKITYEIDESHPNVNYVICGWYKEKYLSMKIIIALMKDYIHQRIMICLSTTLKMT